MAITNPAFEVRQAHLTDQHELSDTWRDFLDEQSSLESRLGIAEDAIERWLNDYPVWLKDESVRIYVATVSSQIVGFVVAHRWAPPPIYADSSEVFVDELYVRKEHRGEGVGAALLSAVREWATSILADRLRISVLEANKAGLDFWKNHGAVPFASTLTIELESDKKRGQGRRKIGFFPDPD